MFDAARFAWMQSLVDRVSRRQALAGALGMAAVGLTEDIEAKKKKRKKKTKKKKKKDKGCPGKQVQCDGQCRDVSTDVEHCGECWETCDEKQVCSAGICTAPCSEHACLKSTIDSDLYVGNLIPLADNTIAAITDDMIAIFDTSGRLLRTIGEFGTGEGEFRNLSDIATGSAQTLYVADAGNDRIQIIHSGGQIEVESFEDVSLVAVAPDALYAAAYDSITRLSSPPEPSYSWGPDGTLGTSFDYLASIATDAAGDVYALDGYVGKVYRFSDDGSGNIERKWEVGGIGVDPGEYRNASALTVAGARVFIADSDNYRVQVLNAVDGSFLFGWTTTDQYGDKTDPDDVGVHPSGMVYVTSWGDIYGYTLKS